jgi:hypothetical protein
MSDAAYDELRSTLRDELLALEVGIQLHDPMFQAFMPDLHRWHQAALAEASAQLHALDAGEDVALPSTMREYVASATRIRVELEISPWSELRTFVSEEPDELVEPER